VVGALLVAPDFGHLGWRARWYPVASGETGIPADAVVVFPTNDSSSWILSTLPGSVQPFQVPRVFSAQPWFPVSAPPLLDDQIAATIRSTDRPVFSVSKARNVAIARSTAGLYGRHVGADGCHEVAALVPLTVCAWEKD